MNLFNLSGNSYNVNQYLAICVFFLGSGSETGVRLLLFGNQFFYGTSYFCAGCLHAVAVDYLSYDALFVKQEKDRGSPACLVSPGCQLSDSIV